MITSPPLSGITIVDLSRILAAPFCTMLASDMGARVIKVEHPDHGDDTRTWGPPFDHGESAYYLSVNRNKESVALNFKAPEGRRLLEALVDRADVLVENFRPGSLDRLGLDYATLSKTRPGLIYVSLSGFGHTGPRREEGGYDAIAQAESGLMSITGIIEGPPVRLGVAIADIVAGMYAFHGLLLALRSRDRTGRGQHVDISLLDAATSALTYQAARFFMTGESVERAGNRHLAIAPYDTFPAADGLLVLAVGNDTMWQNLCRVLERPDLAADDRFATNAGRVRHYGDLQPLLQEAFQTRELAPTVAALHEVGIPSGPVRSIEGALSDPQIAAREMRQTVPHPTIGELETLGIATKLSETPGAIRSAPPRLGEHTRAVLGQDLGVSEDVIAKLAADGVIRVEPPE
jgi:crotonobetainyl-CoA:carnitine CoA-transferase CaiB-like acyl-CoA transferase